jgi:hypothetical protein
MYVECCTINLNILSAALHSKGTGDGYHTAFCQDSIKKR